MAVLNAAMSPPSKAHRSSGTADFSQAREREQQEKESLRERSTVQPHAAKHPSQGVSGSNGRGREVWGNTAIAGMAPLHSMPVDLNQELQQRQHEQQQRTVDWINKQKQLDRAKSKRNPLPSAQAAS